MAINAAALAERATRKCLSSRRPRCCLVNAVHLMVTPTRGVCRSMPGFRAIASVLTRIPRAIKL